MKQRGVSILVKRLILAVVIGIFLLLLCGIVLRGIRSFLIFSLEQSIESYEEEELLPKYEIKTEGTPYEISLSKLLVALESGDISLAQILWESFSEEERLNIIRSEAYLLSDEMATELLRMAFLDDSEKVTIAALGEYGEQDFDTVLSAEMTALAYSENSTIRYDASQHLAYSDVTITKATLEEFNLVDKTPRINLDSLKPHLADSLIATMNEYQRDFNEANSLLFQVSLTDGRFTIIVGERDSTDRERNFSRDCSKQFTMESWRDSYWNNTFILLMHKDQDFLVLTESTESFRASFDSMFKEVLRSPHIREKAAELSIEHIGYSITYFQVDWFSYAEF